MAAKRKTKQRKPDKTGKKQAETQFKPGQSGNPTGRPKGARSRLGEAFLVALETDWKENGKAALGEAREKDPAGYVRVVASLLPKDVNVKHTILEEIEELSDDELRERIEQLERSVAPAATVPTETSVH